MKKLFYIFVLAMLMWASSAVAQVPQYITSWSTGRWPIGIDVADNGNVWVSNYAGAMVQEFTPDGLLVGNLATGVRPYGIAVNDYVYIGSDGSYVWTNFTCPTLCGFATIFSASHSVATDQSGNVYVGDFGGGRIYKYNRDGIELAQFAPARYVEDVCVDQLGNVYALLYINCQVLKFAPDGTLLTSWGSRGTGDGQFGGIGSDWAGAGPEGIGIDSNGNVYVADTMNNRVQVFDSNGMFITKWGSFGSEPGQFNRAEDVTVDASGFIFVSDGYNDRIQKFGNLATPTIKSTWGRVKSLYR